MEKNRKLPQSVFLNCFYIVKTNAMAPTRFVTYLWNVVYISMCIIHVF